MEHAGSTTDYINYEKLERGNRATSFQESVLACLRVERRTNEDDTWRRNKRQGREEKRHEGNDDSISRICAIDLMRKMFEAAEKSTRQGICGSRLLL